jgi:hypothetical protein
MAIESLDGVRILVNHPPDIRRGMVGTVLEVLDRDKGVYLVEFTNPEDGTAIEILELPLSELELAQKFTPPR